MSITSTENYGIAKMTIALELATSTLKVPNSDFESPSNQGTYLELLRRFVAAYEIIQTVDGGGDAQGALKKIEDRFKKEDG